VQFIVALVALAIFWAVSPKLFKFLFKLNFVLSVGGYIVLRILGVLLGATKGGRNVGMLEDEALAIGLSFLGMPVIMLLGVISGTFMAWLGKRSQAQ